MNRRRRVQHRAGDEQHERREPRSRRRDASQRERSSLRCPLPVIDGASDRSIGAQCRPARMRSDLCARRPLRSALRTTARDVRAHQLTSFQISGRRVASSAPTSRKIVTARLQVDHRLVVVARRRGADRPGCSRAPPRGGGRRSGRTARARARSGRAPPRARRASRRTSARLFSAAVCANGSSSSSRASRRLRSSSSIASSGSAALRASTPSMLCTCACARRSASAVASVSASRASSVASPGSPDWCSARARSAWMRARSPRWSAAAASSAARR